GSYCFRSNPQLTSVSLPALTTAGSYCFSSNPQLTEIKIGNTSYQAKDIDGYCFIVETQKTSKGIKIYSGYTFLDMKKGLINKSIGFAAEKEKFFAHGETIKQAVGDLQFKIVSEKLKSEPINADTEMTVKHYRLITGACNTGCRMWLESNNIPYHYEKDSSGNEIVVEDMPITAADLKKMFEKSGGAFGYDKFKTLITF
ncbi:MAG TPA: hypothetical protein VGN20_20440, partial [Mucilaginibacter sp.]